MLSIFYLFSCNTANHESQYHIEICFNLTFFIKLIACKFALDSEILDLLNMMIFVTYQLDLFRVEVDGDPGGKWHKVILRSSLAMIVLCRIQLLLI